MHQQPVDFPLTLALSPVDKFRSSKTDCGGRGNSRKTIYTIISARVKSTCLHATRIRTISAAFLTSCFLVHDDAYTVFLQKTYFNESTKLNVFTQHTVS